MLLAEANHVFFINKRSDDPFITLFLLAKSVDNYSNLDASVTELRKGKISLILKKIIHMHAVFQSEIVSAVSSRKHKIKKTQSQDYVTTCYCSNNSVKQTIQKFSGLNQQIISSPAHICALVNISSSSIDVVSYRKRGSVHHSILLETVNKTDQIVVMTNTKVSSLPCQVHLQPQLESSLPDSQQSEHSYMASTGSKRHWKMQLGTILCLVKYLTKYHWFFE